MKKCELIDEPIEDIIANEGRQLWDIYVERVSGDYNSEGNMFDDQYEGGWPVILQGSGDWGICVNEYPEFDYENSLGTLDETPKARHFFIRLLTNYTPEPGKHFAFLNQFDKRITNEELYRLVNSCTDSEHSELCYQLNVDSNEFELFACEPVGSVGNCDSSEPL